jgi:glycosyltransferase involved in cell wall biosynthesis
MSLKVKRRVLIVAHNFPPLASGGVHRPVKFARYLRELGWEVEVLSVKNIRYHAYDPSLTEELAGVRVHRAGSLEPMRLVWLSGWRPPPPLPAVNSFADLEEAAVRNVAKAVPAAARAYTKVTRHIFQPDDQIFWVPFAAARAAQLVEERPFDVVLTTSPPESCHLVGLALKKIAGARWVADFRDAWSTHHLKRGLAFYNKYIGKILEKWVVRAADGVVANTEELARHFRAVGGPGLRVLTLRNGFDPADWGEPQAKVNSEDYVVVHNGSFRGGRRARPLLEGFAEARARDADFAARAKLYLLGINRADDLRAAEELALADVVYHVGYLRHADAVRACQGADLLVLAMAAEEGPALVPGKLYEYLGVGRPILAAVPPGEARTVLAGATRGAVIVAPEDPHAIARGLLGAFAPWRRGEVGYETNEAAISTYTRPVQVEKLSRFLEAVVT